MIREMTKNDVPFFNEVRNECSKYLHDKSTHTLEEALNWFSLKGDKNPYFIYELNNEKIGYFRTSKWTKDSCYIGMDIHKNFRGNGLATEAYNKFIKYIKNRHLNIKTMMLEVLETNQRAYKLYKKIGFKEIDRYAYNNDFSIVMELKC